MASNSWVGQTLGGRYKIEEILGQGGMSAVYRASDPNLHRTVAVKIIHSHLSNNEEFLRRFEEEASSVAQLRHPNIIQVFDFNHEGNVYYMVMEYIPGETLFTRLKRLNRASRRLPYAETLRYAINICDAADYAHKRSMIHRDIKPANIMLDLNGQAILMDFGIAKIVGGQQHTASGAVLGTALYMSPEQIRGERFDYRTDIYSIGVTLFEMIHGRTPYDAETTMALMMMHLNDPVPDLRLMHPDAPEGLVRAVEKAMAKDAGERFQSAAEMAAYLRKVQAILQGDKASSGISSGKIQIHSPSSRSSAYPSLAQAGLSGRGLAAGTAPAPATRVISRPQIVGGCLAVLLAMLFFVSGSAVLAKQFFPEAQNAFPALATAMMQTMMAGPSPVPGQTTPVPGTSTPDSDLSVEITSISIEGDHYRVEYETTGFIESPTGKHIHFFYNNIKPEDAGAPGPGPWMKMVGPRPFTGAKLADRPPDATQICALVAYPDHHTIPGSGNCVDLPSTP